MQTTFIQIGLFIVNSLATFLVGAVLLRFLLQWVRADFYNPLSQAIVQITNPLLKPLRKIIPGWAGLDLAALVLALGLQLVFVTLILLMSGASAGFYGGAVVIWALIEMALLVIGIYLIAMVVVSVASFIAPHSRHFALLLLHQLLDPISRPLRNKIPPLGGLDLSFMLLFAVLMIIRMLLMGIGREMGLPY
jgi:YggT family protein